MSYTYAQLKQAIQDYVETTETTFVANVPLFIRSAEERILKSVQLSLFRKNATTTLSSGSQYLPCPSDFLSPWSLSFTPASGDKTFLRFKSVSFVQSYNPGPSDTGSPRYYAQFDVDNFILSPTTDASYTAELHYLYRPASITAGAEDGTTWLSTNADLSLLYACLIEAYIFLKGEQDLLSYYDKRFNESLMGLKQLGEAKETTDEYDFGQLIRPKQ